MGNSKLRLYDYAKGASLWWYYEQIHNIMKVFIVSDLFRSPKFYSILLPLILEVGKQALVGKSVMPRLILYY